MGNRSNINVVGNTVQGQNLGAGDACVFKCKAGGNLLQFRSISSTGTSIQVIQSGDEILISGATGGGGGGLTASSNGLTDNGSTVCLGGTLSQDTYILQGSQKLVISGDTDAGLIVDNNNQCIKMFGNTFNQSCIAITSGQADLIECSGGYCSRITQTCNTNETITYQPSTSCSCIITRPDNLELTARNDAGTSCSSVLLDTNNASVCSKNNAILSGKYTKVTATGNTSTMLLSGSSACIHTCIGPTLCMWDLLPGVGFPVISIGACGGTKDAALSLMNSSAAQWSTATLGAKNSTVAIYGCNVGVTYPYSIVLDSSANTTCYSRFVLCACNNPSLYTSSQSQPINYGGDYSAKFTANSLITKAYLATFTGGSGGITWNGSTANAVGTYGSSSTIDAESNLTFDGTILNVTGIAYASTCMCSAVVCGTSSVKSPQISGTTAVCGAKVSAGCYQILGSDVLRYAVLDATSLMIGRCAGGSLHYGSFGPNNIAIGECAYNGSNTFGSGYDNISIGNNTMRNINNGLYNTAIGTNALNKISDGCNNVAIGCNVLSATTTGCGNFGVGCLVLVKNTTGSNNIGVGCISLCSNTTGYDNIALGSFAMNKNTIGAYNLGLGFGALSANVSGNHNVAIGFGTVGANVCGCGNVGIGNQSLSNNKVGGCNVGIGYNTMYQITSGHSNVSIGNVTAGAITTGCYNVGVGHQALASISTGNYNVAIGPQSGFYGGAGATTGTSNVFIGRLAGYGQGGSNKLFIANTSGCSLIYGEFNTKMVRVCGCMCITALPARTTETCVVYVDGSGKLSCGPASTGGTGGCCIGWSCASTESTSVGCNAMPDTITGLYNSAFGNYALTSNTTGSNNTAIGWGALYSNTCGIENIALGALTMENNTSGCSNIAIGTFALCSNTNGDCNIAIGRDALAFNTTANENIAIGREAVRGSNTVIGNSNIGIGTCALRSNCDGCENIAIGCGALQSNIDGFDNVAVGARALYAATGAWDNTAIGWRALQFTTIGGSNTAVGTSALGANISGDTNTAVGLGALNSNTKGCCNVAVGGSALSANIGGHFNVAIGQYAATYVCGSCNIAIGINALRSGNGAGCNNIAIGTKALSGSTTGCDNIAIGNEALRTTTTQYGNIAIGCCALYANTSTYNIAIGDGALMKRTTAASTEGDLVAIGRAALQQITTGRRSVALGALALQWSTGDENTAVGYSALNQNTTGSYNTAIGACALYENCGSGNVAIGDSAFKGSGNTTFSGSVAIGCGAGYGYNISNTLVIANNNSSFLIRGCFSNNTICNAADSASWNTSSDIRIKENVATILCATDTLSQLNPVLFDYTENYSKQRSWDECKRICNYGFVAQEFEQVFPKYVTKGIGKINDCEVDDFRTINDGHLVPLLVKAIQEQQLEINELKNKLNRFNL